MSEVQKLQASKSSNSSFNEHSAPTKAVCAPSPLPEQSKNPTNKVSLRILFRELVLVFQKLPCLSCYHSVLQEPPEAFAGFLLGCCVAGLYCLTSLLLFSFLWQPPAYFLAPQLGWGPLSNLTRDPYFPATSTFVWCQYLPLSSLSYVLFPSFFLASPSPSSAFWSHFYLHGSHILSFQFISGCEKQREVRNTINRETVRRGIVYHWQRAGGEKAEAISSARGSNQHSLKPWLHFTFQNSVAGGCAEHVVCNPCFLS